jgi:hypothetical protein
MEGWFCGWGCLLLWLCPGLGQIRAATFCRRSLKNVTPPTLARPHTPRASAISTDAAATDAPLTADACSCLLQTLALALVLLTGFVLPLILAFAGEYQTKAQFLMERYGMTLEVRVPAALSRMSAALARGAEAPAAVNGGGGGSDGRDQRLRLFAVAAAPASRVNAFVLPAMAAVFGAVWLVSQTVVSIRDPLCRP